MEVDERVLDYAHPWLGTTRRQIEGRGLYSFSHFVFGHLGQLVLTYSMYEACQLHWVDLFYGQPYSFDFPFVIFSSLFALEFFVMVYVRSASRYVDNYW